MPKTMKELMDTLPQTGCVEWIGLRPGRKQSLLSVTRAQAIAQTGLHGDHHDNPGGKRQATLIQAEHLEAVASILQQKAIDPALCRRNIVVRGINLQSLKDRRFAIGSVIMETTGDCHPCSRMEENLGPGGYNAMRGHGGITARILTDGEISIGDTVRLLPNDHA